MWEFYNEIANLIINSVIGLLGVILGYLLNSHGSIKIIITDVVCYKALGYRYHIIFQIQNQIAS